MCFMRHAGLDWAAEPPSRVDPTPPGPPWRRGGEVEGPSLPAVELTDGSINSTASQSRRAGCEGGLPLRPKSKTDGTSGAPKCRIQMWLIAARAVRGFSRLATHCARASRRPVLVAGYTVPKRV